MTFLVTAITARLPPLLHLEDSEGAAIEDSHECVTEAWQHFILKMSQSPPLHRQIMESFFAGLKMAGSILPTIMFVGAVGLVLARYTPFFDGLGWIFYPFCKLMHLAEPEIISKSLSSGLAEVFLPSLLARDAMLETRLVVAVSSVSSILFLSASIPCIVFSGIPLSIGSLLVIWLERMILSIVLSGLLVHVFF